MTNQCFGTQTFRVSHILSYDGAMQYSLYRVGGRLEGGPRGAVLRGVTRKCPSKCLKKVPQEVLQGVLQELHSEHGGKLNLMSYWRMRYLTGHGVKDTSILDIPYGGDFHAVSLGVGPLTWVGKVGLRTGTTRWIALSSTPF